MKRFNTVYAKLLKFKAEKQKIRYFLNQVWKSLFIFLWKFCHFTSGSPRPPCAELTPCLLVRRPGMDLWGEQLHLMKEGGLTRHPACSLQPARTSPHAIDKVQSVGNSVDKWPRKESGGSWCLYLKKLRRPINQMSCVHLVWLLIWTNCKKH